MTKFIPLALVLAVALAGCESDYTLGLETPTSLVSATPTASLTPPQFSPTPSPTPGTPEPGAFVALLRVEPQTLEFGPLIVGCQAAATVTVINDGTVPVSVTNVRLTSAGKVVGLSISDDLATLNPGDEGHIWVEATARAIGEEGVDLWVDASEGPAARVPIRSVVAESTSEIVDTYYQQPQNDTDVLWVIDNSGSMSDQQKRLAQNFDAFMDNFIPLGIRYHMAVVTTDMLNPSQSGRMQGSFNADNQHFIDWTMKEQGDEAFRQTIQRLGSNGSGAEQGLIAMESALDVPLSATYNAGFLREDAFLSVIIVSDEQDQSPPDPKTGAYTDRYIDFLVQLKGGVEHVVVSSILRYAESGGYVEVSRSTGGLVHNINDPDYYQVLLDIGWISAGFQVQYSLSRVPVSSSAVRVRVNEIELAPGPTTWSYDDDLKAVVFAEESIPADGDRIDIIYTTYLTCSDLSQPKAVAKDTSAKP